MQYRLGRGINDKKKSLFIRDHKMDNARTTK
jgi:hypothetical protein